MANTPEIPEDNKMSLLGIQAANKPLPPSEDGVPNAQGKKPVVIQTIKITLSNGAVGFFTGVAIVTPQDEVNDVTITEVVFGELQEIPEGYTWELFENTDDSED